MKETFNLVDQPWIPCITATGALKQCGLLETLSRANELKEIRDPSPLVTISLHRLLLAVLHRIFGPESPEVWARLWQDGNGNFEAARLETYLKKPEIFSRFDLFDDKHPFYQTASLPLGETDKTTGRLIIDKETGRPKYVKPICRMAHELAYSDSMNLFAHFTDSDWETRPAGEAARWLVAFQSFAHSNLVTFEEGRTQDKSADAAPLVKSAIVLAKGESLFQTFMLNLVHYSADDEVPFTFKASKDKPAWERDDTVQADDRRYDGYLDLLTWQSRRVRLVPEQNGENALLKVSGVVMMKGWQLPGFDRYGRETMVGFLKFEKAQKGQDPWPPLGFRFGKALWRDSHALFQSVSEKSERPKVLSWIDDLRQEGLLDRKQVLLNVFGISSNTAKIFFWRHESLPLPLDYLKKDASLLESLNHVLELAEEVGKVLVAAVWLAAATTLKPGKDERKLGKKSGM